MSRSPYHSMKSESGEEKQSSQLVEALASWAFFLNKNIDL